MPEHSRRRSRYVVKLPLPGGGGWCDEDRLQAQPPNANARVTYASLDRATQRDEHVSYSTAPTIRGPWTYRGLLTGSGKYSFTIRPGIVQFKNNWYLFLHNAALSIGDLNGAIGRRAVTVEHLQYNADGTMKLVNQTEAGVTAAPAK